MLSILQKHLISRALILLWRSAVSVQASQPYKKTDIAKERISRIFGLRESSLLCQMCLSLLIAAVVWAILARISGFEPSSDIMAPRYLKVETSLSFCPLSELHLWIFRLPWPWSFLHWFPCHTPLLSSLALQGILLVRPRCQLGHLCHWRSESRLYFFLQCWLFRHGFLSVIILSKKRLKRMVESRHPCLTPTVALNQSPSLLLKSTVLVALLYRFYQR